MGRAATERTERTERSAAAIGATSVPAAEPSDLAARGHAAPVTEPIVRSCSSASRRGVGQRHSEADATRSWAGACSRLRHPRERRRSSRAR